MDALYDERKAYRAQQIGLFNSAAEIRKEQPVVLAVHVDLASGVRGLGCVTLGSEGTAQFIEQVLAPLVIGQKVFDVEHLWEKMYRATVNVGRRGAVLHAISGIDIGIWDAMGKSLGQPCYNLLGGRTRQAIRAYCSSAYAMDDLDQLSEIVSRQMKRGYTALKLRFGWGPLDGKAGIEKNVALVRRMRELVGSGTDLMADAYMGWDLNYALAIFPKLEEFDLTWIEEPLMPDDVRGYAYLRSRSRIPIAGGEHEATRWGFRQLIESQAVDYLQPDVNRVGGVTEARKIWAVAQSFDVKVIPHSGDYHNLHLVMSHMNSPMAEHFPDDYLDGDTFLGRILQGSAEFRDGNLYLNDAPGFGVSIRNEYLGDAAGDDRE